MVLKMEFEKEFEDKFRQAAMKKFGYKKGALQMAGKKALGSWVREEEKKLPQVDNPVSLIDGILSHLKGKYTSVELQHEAVKLWLKEK